MARLSDPISILKGIGPAKAKQFANLNIYTLLIYTFECFIIGEMLLVESYIW